MSALTVQIEDGVATLTMSRPEARNALGAEMKDASIEQKLKRIKEKTASATARSQLDELKGQLAARKAASDASASVKKTM